MTIELWYVPLLAMTVVILPPSVSWLVGWLRDRTVAPDGTTGRRRRRDGDASGRSARWERVRTQVMAVLTLVLLCVCFFAIGPEVTSLIATLASAVSTVVAAALTVQSFLALQEIRRETMQQSAASTVDDAAR